MSLRILSSQLGQYVDKPIVLEGWVHRVRDLGGVRFLVLRDRAGLAQVVLPADLNLSETGCETVVRIHGTVRREQRAPGGLEVLSQSVHTVAPAEPPPLEVYRPYAKQPYRLDTLLDHRAVSLRIPDVLDVFRIQAEILRTFRDFLTQQGFTEIATPKLVLAGAEGGAAVFEVEYYDRKAYLAQSPQFYKQMMVGSGLERVFEVGHAYRAEKSETSRHITEFVSLDFEMGFIESEQDVMRMHSSAIRAIFAGVRDTCGQILTRRGLDLPDFLEIPQVSYPQARRILADKYKKTEGIHGDLDTEGERLIGQWAEEEFGSPLLFVTGYAVDKRPVYTMPSTEDPSLTRSFDLLYKGIEITTGGQRIHHYDQLVESFRRRGLNPQDVEGYLECFRHGMPPHGGMGMGLERLTKQMLGLANIKEACLFPRDRNRLTP